MKEKKILQSAIDIFGDTAQTDMMIEEMSELTKALLKYRRDLRRGGQMQTLCRMAVLEEMADVGIMLDQMRIIYGSENEYREEKLKRLAERLGMKVDE